MNIPSIPEYAGPILTVPGRFFPAHAWDGARFSSQTWVSESRAVSGYGTNGKMHVEIRFDDQCKNGHNTFTITASIYTAESRRQRDCAAGGCMHDEIAAAFPELVPLIKWHLTSSDGPMHYIANTIFHASDRDCWGLLAGEERQIVNGRTKLPSWRLAYVDAQGNEVVRPEQYSNGEAAPAIVAALVYLPWNHVGEGKARNFDHARSCAVWPDATDAELSVSADELRAALTARHPALLAEFRAAMDSSGLKWSPL